jgi:hypothetical protein
LLFGRGFALEQTIDELLLLARDLEAGVG